LGGSCGEEVNWINNFCWTFLVVDSLILVVNAYLIAQKGAKNCGGSQYGQRMVEFHAGEEDSQGRERKK
jgi:hypothetical protein